MEYCTIPLKTCTKCNRLLPATLMFFHKQNNGLVSWCNDCIAERDRLYRQTNKEKIAERRKQYRKANRDKLRDIHRQYVKDNLEALQEYQKEYQKQWYQDNKERLAKQRKEYRKVNREKIAANVRKWQKANKGKVRLINLAHMQRRNARKRGLPNTFTSQEWIACLEYHHYCCAVCGNQLRDLFGNVEPHADHWHPLSVDGCPGTVAENMICLCSTCNQQKTNKLPAIWLTEKFGTRKANEILARVAAYFEWVISRQAPLYRL
jgi:5-methylcytosine-specific restriction endonuclease McrA